LCQKFGVGRKRKQRQDDSDDSANQSRKPDELGLFFQKKGCQKQDEKVDCQIYKKRKLNFNNHCSPLATSLIYVKKFTKKKKVEKLEKAEN
jgi:hypothetical protein